MVSIIGWPHRLPTKLPLAKPKEGIFGPCGALFLWCVHQRLMFTCWLNMDIPYLVIHSTSGPDTNDSCSRACCTRTLANLEPTTKLSTAAMGRRAARAIVMELPPF